MKISPARVAAFDALSRIERDRAFSASVLPTVENDLSPNDAGLCHELVLGVLRRQIYLDRLIDTLAGAKKIDAAVRIALRLGVYQLLCLDKIPPHAAINESVELVKRAKKTSAKGFVNAILRRLQKGTPKLSFESDAERIAVETSHPQWLIERWVDQFGVEETVELAVANNRTPGVGFRRTLLGREADLSAFTPSIYVQTGYVSNRMTESLLRLSQEGLIYFQDEGSQLVAESVTSVVRFLDICAAPGGKITQIGLRPDLRTSLLVAGDLHRRRTEFLRENCIRQGLENINIVQYDASVAIPFEENSFDAVLVDAPCSGTGTIAHNPEIRYFLEAKDIAELSNKQLRILENASKVVAPNGLLIYSTCSLERDENEEVCERFLVKGGFAKVAPSVPTQLISTQGFARTFPHKNGMDGFFVATFRKL